MLVLRGRVLAILALSLWLLPRAAQATPFTSSHTTLEDTNRNFFSNDGGSSSFLIVGSDVATSFVNVNAGTMGALLDIPTGVFFARTETRHDDDWFCNTAGGAVCATVPNLASVPALLSVKFDAVVSQEEMSFLAQYTTSAGAQFSVSFFQDPTFEGGASFSDGSGAVDVPLVVTVDNNGNFHVSASVSSHIDFHLAAFCGADCPTALLSDSQTISAELEGVGLLDASHTFSVTLTSLDPNIVLTSADGRTGGSPAAPAPVPEPTSLMLFGTGLIGVVGRVRARTASPDVNSR
jgi:hypothetical protein